MELSTRSLMIGGAPANPPTDLIEEATQSEPSVLRVGPALVLVAAFWTFMCVNHTLELSSATRFVSRLIAVLLLVLGFTVWWLSRTALSRRHRILAIIIVFAVGGLAGLVADKTMTPLRFFLATQPAVLTAWTLWILVARGMDPFIQRAGFCALMMIVCGYFTVVRFDGLDARQNAETSWRWTPTREQTFLAARPVSVNVRSNHSSTPSAWQTKPGDCAEIRGSRRDGVITSVRLATDWSAHPPRELWRKKVGPAWSGMIVVDGHLVTQEQRGNKEVVACYNAATGDELWVHEDESRFEESLSGAGPRGTPTFSDDRIFTYGGKGLLNCLKPETGEVIWMRNCAADADVGPSDIPQWGYSCSPLVVDGLVIVFAGGAKRSLLAYHQTDGKLAWASAGGKQSYSSPQRVTLHGLKQIVMHDNRSLKGFGIGDGELLWEVPGTSEISLPMLQPHEIENNNLVVSTEPELSSIEVKRVGDNWSASRGWKNNKLRAGFNDFVVHDGSVFALDDGVLCCLDLSNGQRRWKKGRLGHGQMLVFPEQNLVLLLIEKGEAILVSVDRAGHKELGRFKALEGKTWNSPVLVGTRLFVRNGEEMAAYELATETDTEKSESKPPL